MNVTLQHLLFIDIETIAQHEEHDQLSERLKPLWEKKVQYYLDKEGYSVEESYVDKAAIFAEFGKVISIGLGFFSLENEQQVFRVKALSGHSEKELLANFLDVISKFKQNQLVLCGHNIKEFDIPFLCRRLLVNQLQIPYALDVSGKKPWEVNFIDTMHLWRFGDYKHFTSLETLAAIFDVPTSKEGIDGSKVYHAYYKEKALDKITEYCKRDVVVTMQVYLRLKSLPILSDHQIVYI